MHDSYVADSVVAKTDAEKFFIKYFIQGEIEASRMLSCIGIVARKHCRGVYLVLCKFSSHTFHELFFGSAITSNSSLIGIFEG